jgi:acyl-CoA thioesterase II
MSAPVNSALADLLAILDLTPMADNRFQGRSLDVGWQRIFGGLVVSQALVAVSRTVAAALSPHSLHAYFILPGDPDVPIDYEVDALRDGRSFATRRVVARQAGAAIFALSASFQIMEEGHDHQWPMPDVPQPEALMAESDFVAAFADHLPENVRRYFSRKRPIELRPVSLTRYMGGKPSAADQSNPAQHVWFRATGALPDDPAIHRAVLAYASDMTLLDTALVAHGTTVFSPAIQAASLDHAMWLHRSFRADDWLLYSQDSPSSSGARGLARGQIYDRNGRLVASVAQEGLIRPRPDRLA